MNREKKHSRVEFDSRALRKVIEAFMTVGEVQDGKLKHSSKIFKGAESWSYDDLEEFLSLADDPENNKMCLRLGSEDLTLTIWIYPADIHPSTSEIGSNSRTKIIKIGNVLDEQAMRCHVAEAHSPVPKPRVFIGHGGSSQWRDLKDHLKEKHRYDVVAYETGARWPRHSRRIGRHAD